MRTLIGYVVEFGDTLSEIAERYRTSVSELMQCNPQIVNPGLIYEGQTLTIPMRTVEGRYRQTGRTTTQINYAPKMAAYVGRNHGHAMLLNKEFHHRRADIRFISLNQAIKEARAGSQHEHYIMDHATVWEVLRQLDSYDCSC